MRSTRTDIMGMPITIDIVGADDATAFEEAFAYLERVDERFSTYKENSEISRINRGELSEEDCSEEMREVFALAERTKDETDGYFDMRTLDGALDPSGIVKGWAVKNAAALIEAAGYADYMLEAAGDIATGGANSEGAPWRIGIRNPWNRDEIVAVVEPQGKGIATSGSYARGSHIYDPHASSRALDEIVSVTVIADDVLEADRFATAAFAMGAEGIAFIERTPGLEGYAIDRDGMATMTSGFPAYTHA